MATPPTGPRRQSESPETPSLNRRSFLAAAAAAAGGVWAGPATAAQIDQVLFEDRLRTRDSALKLLGTGLLYYKVVLKVVAAGLYLDERAAPGDVLGDFAKRLEMQYFWGVKAKDLVTGSKRMLARNLPADRVAALEPQFEAMHALYQDVRASDRCSLTYLPGVGTWLTRNGKVLGSVAGADFAAAYFSIWFGEKPMDAGLKRKLLGA